MDRLLRAALTKARRGTSRAQAKLSVAELEALDKAIADATTPPPADPEGTRQLILRGARTIVELNGRLSVSAR